MSVENECGDAWTFHEGAADWHDGPGWYYTYDDYPDEGSCGAFKTRREAMNHAEGLMRSGRFAYTFHNIVGHPAMEILHLLGFDKAANWVHDKTLPKKEVCNE